MEPTRWGATRELQRNIAQRLTGNDTAGDESPNSLHGQLCSTTAAMADLVDRYLTAVLETEGRVYTNALERAAAEFNSVLQTYMDAYEGLAVGLPARYPDGTKVLWMLTPRQASALHSVGRPPAVTNADLPRLELVCPRCSAMPGEYCRTESGWYAKYFHRERQHPYANSAAEQGLPNPPSQPTPR